MLKGPQARYFLLAYYLKFQINNFKIAIHYAPIFPCLQLVSAIAPQLNK
jgi:hypothetical protein